MLSHTHTHTHWHTHIHSTTALVHSTIINKRREQQILMALSGHIVRCDFDCEYDSAQPAFDCDVAAACWLGSGVLGALMVVVVVGLGEALATASSLEV